MDPVKNHPYDNEEFEDSYDADSLETEATNMTIDRDFQENVVKWVSIDEEIKKKNAQIRELKLQQKSCEEFVLGFLEDTDTTVEITGGFLRANKVESKTSLNKKLIETALLSKLNDKDVVNDLLETMEELREVRERVSLKRTNKKK